MGEDGLPTGKGMVLEGWTDKERSARMVLEDGLTPVMFSMPLSKVWNSETPSGKGDLTNVKRFQHLIAFVHFCRNAPPHH